MTFTSTTLFFFAPLAALREKKRLIYKITEKELFRIVSKNTNKPTANPPPTRRQPHLSPALVIPQRRQHQRAAGQQARQVGRLPKEDQRDRHRQRDFQVVKDRQGGDICTPRPKVPQEEPQPGSHHAQDRPASTPEPG